MIGAGYFSQFHVEAWTAMHANGIVAGVSLCDSDEARARELGKRFGVTRIYTDAARMLAEVGADLVDIVTKTVKTASWQDALKRNDWTDMFLAGDAFKTFMDSDTQRIDKILAGLGMKK